MFRPLNGTRVDLLMALSVLVRFKELLLRRQRCNRFRTVDEIHLGLNIYQGSNDQHQQYCQNNGQHFDTGAPALSFLFPHTRSLLYLSIYICLWKTIHTAYAG
jgi:hypothetical protein